MTPEMETEYRGALEAALRAGWDVLEKGGPALDAVEASVVSLEDFPLFNAGRGSVFTHEGKNELDAAIMDGSNQKAGAVAFVRNVKNPVRLARLVMEKTPHVLLAGDGADRFAEEIGAQLVDTTYYYTDFRWKQLEEAVAAERVQLDHAAAKPMSTVGAVACDSQGRLASATSTGGMTNKRYGRVGDTAIIGAGTYANDICAISCTGHGEFFIREVTGHDLASRMKFKGMSLQDAANETINQLTSIGGEGGFIAVDSSGNVVLPFNSEGMYRGWMETAGDLKIEIYR